MTVNDDFIRACKSGTLKKVRLFIKYKKIDMNYRDKNGDNALIAAFSKKDNNKLIKYLLNKFSDIDINCQDSYGFTPLMFVCYYRDMDMIKHLVENFKININLKQYRDVNAVMIDSNEELNMYLLSKFPEININDREKSGLSLMDLRVMHRNFNVIDYILQNFEIDVNVRVPLNERHLIEFLIERLDILKRMLDKYTHIIPCKINCFNVNLEFLNLISSYEFFDDFIQLNKDELMKHYDEDVVRYVSSLI